MLAEALAERLLAHLRGRRPAAALHVLERLSAGAGPPGSADQRLRIASDAEADAGRLGWAARLRALAFTLARQAARDTRADEGALLALRAAGAPIPVGTLLLSSPLGGGGTGEVWLGARGEDPRPVAVKVVHPRTPRIAQGFEAEVRTLARLDHPSVTWLLDRGRVPLAASRMAPELAEGAPWLATDYATHGTLHDACGTLAWPEARRVLLRLLDALAHAHARGVLHLDVKPANVLLAGDPARPEVLLADFGLALWLTDAAGRRAAGTPAYMAPEQFAGRLDRLGPATDLYAFGATAWELVTGAPPFAGDSPSVLRTAHVSHALGLPSPRIAVPPGLTGWLGRLLAKSPGHRFRSAAAAARALVALGDATVAPAPRTPRPTWSELTTLDLDAFDHPELPGRGTGSPRAPLPASPETRRRPAPRPDATPTLLPWRDPPLVGREEAQGALWAALREATAGRAAARLGVDGDPGSGRTRLGRWLVERCRELDAVEVLALTAAPAAELRAWLAGDAGATDAEEAGWASWLAGTASPAVAGGLLRRRLERRGEPTLVWIDDLPDAAAFAAVLASPRAPALVLFTDTLPSGVATLHLPPLPEADVRRLVTTRLHVHPDVTERVLAEAHGNPGRVDRALRRLAEGGLEPGPDGVCGLSAEAPASLVDRSAAPRVPAGCPPEAVAGLAVAGALGVEVARDELAAVLARTGGSPSALPHLVAQGRLREDGDGWRFVDPDDAAALATLADAGIHETCAEVLSERGAPRARVGHHLVAAGDVARGAIALVEDGTRAHLAAARRALEGARLAPDHPAWIRVHEVDVDTGGDPEVLAAVAPDHRLVRFWRAVGALNRREFDLAFDALTAVRARFPAEDLRCDLALGALLRRRGDLEAAVVLASDALARAVPGAQRIRQAGIATTLAMALQALERTAEAEAAVDRGVAALGNDLAPLRRAELAALRGSLASARGDDAAAEQHYLESLRWKELEGGHDRATWVNLALVRFSLGRVAEALEAVAAAQGPEPDAPHAADLVLLALTLAELATADDATWSARFHHLAEAPAPDRADTWAFRQALERVVEPIRHRRPDRAAQVEALAARLPRRPAAPGTTGR